MRKILLAMWSTGSKKFLPRQLTATDMLSCLCASSLPSWLVECSLLATKFCSMILQSSFISW